MISIATNHLSFRIREGAKGDEIFDSLRKKWVVLSPEEWVRQSLLGYLVHDAKYPASLIAVERGVKVGELSRRFDAMVHGRDGKPWMLIECKAPGESIDNSAVSQLLAYQSILGAKYLLLANGTSTRCWQILSTQVIELDSLPSMS
jgi:hypothetical protein